METLKKIDNHTNCSGQRKISIHSVDPSSLQSFTPSYKSVPSYRTTQSLDTLFLGPTNMEKKQKNKKTKKQNIK